MQSSLLNFYIRYILNKPIIVIIVLLGVFTYLGFQARDFRLDASADSLILENDQDYKYFSEINKKYGTARYLLMTYKPKGDLLSHETLMRLSSLRDELKEIERVSSVFTILDVPLLRNPPVPIKELMENIKNLEDPVVDLQLARTELSTSPIYQELLISQDMKMTALIINLADDKEFERIISRKSELMQKKANNAITSLERSELERLKLEYRECKIRLDKEKHSDIAAVRRIMDGYRQDAELFLGGVSMITDDMITFIRNDIKIFGIGILIFLIIALGVIFKKVRWVLLPILCCVLSVIAMIGLLGLFGWEVTVISSNFISLQLIITMALTIHLIVRYRELLVEHPEWSEQELVQETVLSKFTPCLYTTLTTIAGFGSLLFSGILPVITFGWMMSLGLIVSLVVTFLLFPAILFLLPAGKLRAHKEFGGALTRILASVTQDYPKTIFISTGILVVIIVVGISRITVENSFIDYFRKSTEIYQGMKIIDQDMGGTTPLDILVNFQEIEDTPPLIKDTITEPTVTDQDMGITTPIDVVVDPQKIKDIQLSNQDATMEPDDDFSAFDEFDEVDNSDKYWFTADKMAIIMKVHDYLDSLPEIGKVLSLGTMLKLAEEFTDGKPLDNFQLALIYTQLPDEFKDMVLSPYVSIPDNQARLTVRIKDSLTGLKRDSLLKKIRSDMENKLDLEKVNVHLSGIMILYNNMLQSLFSSQILTIGFVVLALMVMFTILFRSIKIALIAIIPNVISALAVLGVMGLAGLPLDMMTITIAAISIGIAVDDTIHYIHRFKEEYEIDRNYINSMHRCHGSIGNAMYYTSLTIVAGFFILVFSNFIPTILFGLLTSLAMIIAIITALTLLPRLIIALKPFGK
ncbi:MAG: MMPL family transporter [Candidatus Scalindua sp.]|nr:MMPL family transporter [Candidatus Scalindua sp.]MCR4343552.1 MMPL family transporter [Candidatus Scalindua sp.]